MDYPIDYWTFYGIIDWKFWIPEKKAFHITYHKEIKEVPFQAVQFVGISLDDILWSIDPKEYTEVKITYKKNIT